MTTISIVIPNYNGAALLEKNLKEVTKLASANKTITEIIVVDDGSTDNSVVLINNKFANVVKLIQKNTNTGFGDTVNTGVNASLGDFVLLLNTDTIPVSLNQENLAPYLKMDNLFAVGFLDQSVEKGGIVERGRGIGIFHRGFLLHRKGRLEEQNTLWASSGSSLYNKRIWQKLGGLDLIYSPFYWEDLDISYRALKRGYLVLFARNLIVSHFHDKGAIRTHFTSQKINSIALRNQLIFVWKNITDTGFVLNHLFYLPIHLFSTIIKGDFSFLLAFFQALAKMGQILKKRAIEYRQKKVSDTELLKVFRKEFDSL